MKLLTQNKDILCGIYEIKNTQTNKIYLGSTINLKKRYYIHCYLLRNNKHHCKHLQNSYNEYGSEVFVMDLVLPTTMETLINKEQEFLDKYWDGGKQCYNHNQNAGSSLGLQHTQKAKDKISKANKGKRNGMYGKPAWNKGIAPSPETRKKLSIAGKGKLAGSKNPMFGVKGVKHPSTKIFKVDIVNKVTGEKINGPVVGACTLAKELSINAGYFCKFLAGEYESCKGWTICKRW